MGTAKHVTILCLVATLAGAAAAPSFADEHAPISLRMREPRPLPLAPSPPVRRVAQVPPDGSAGAPPARPITDEDGNIISREDGKTEVISVTDVPIEHELFTGRAPVSVVTRADLTG